jgi:hypothetical protein
MMKNALNEVAQPMKTVVHRENIFLCFVALRLEGHKTRFLVRKNMKGKSL